MPQNQELFDVGKSVLTVHIKENGLSGDLPDEIISGGLVVQLDEPETIKIEYGILTFHGYYVKHCKSIEQRYKLDIERTSKTDKDKFPEFLLRNGDVYNPPDTSNPVIKWYLTSGHDF